MRSKRLIGFMIAFAAVVAALWAAPLASGSESETPAAATSVQDPAGELAQSNAASSEASVSNESVAAQVAGQEIAGGSAGEDAGDAGAQPADEPIADGAEASTPEPSQTQIAESEAEVDQHAGAEAEAEQESPDNAAVTVAVGDGGDRPGVGQANHAEAQAQADVDAQAPSGANAAQSASAQSSADQADAGNVNVTVLVDSPGSTGAVVQANTASATAGSAATANVPGGVQTAEAVAAATQTSPSNTNVSIRVDSPGENGPVTQSNTASATSSASTSPGGSASSEAQATQSGALNTNLAIRVDSPGTDGPVAQANGTIETALVDGDVVTVESASGGLNIDIGIDVATGLGFDAPETWTWSWQWVWDLSTTPDWTSFLEAVAADPWSWIWGEDAIDPESQLAVASGSEPAASGAEAPEDQQTGTWTWTWTWVTDVEGWEWEWTWNATAPCACTWDWEWDWQWTNVTAAASESSELVAATDSPAEVGQANAATAGAVAQASVVVEQEIGQTQAGGSQQQQTGLQSAGVSQIATALAGVHQADALNLTNALGGTVEQDNQVAASSESLAVSASFQLILQEQEGEGSEQWQWAGQVVSVAQHAATESAATQEAVSNVNESDGSTIVQQNAAGAASAASVESVLVQAIAQYQTGSGSIQSQDAGQIATIAQDHAALASSDQADAANGNLSVGGSFDQSNSSVANADSRASSNGLQVVDQAAAGEGEIDVQEAWQILEVLQGGTAIAVASQSQVTNENAYFAPGPSGQGEPGPSGQGEPGPPAPDRASPWFPGGSPSPQETLLATTQPAGLAPHLAPVPVVVAVAAPGGEAPAAGAAPSELPVELGGVAGAAYHVSASHAGEHRASATRGPSYGGRLAVDAVPEEAEAPPPEFAPSEPGAIAGASQGTSSSGPAATAARLTLHVPEVTFRSTSPAVRRPAAIGSSLEHPG